MTAVSPRRKVAVLLALTVAAWGVLLLLALVIGNAVAWLVGAR